MCLIREVGNAVASCHCHVTSWLIWSDIPWYQVSFSRYSRDETASNNPPTHRSHIPLAHIAPVLTDLLELLWQCGVVPFASLRLQIREGKFREPDLMLLRDANDLRRENRYWTGADL